MGVHRLEDRESRPGHADGGVPQDLARIRVVGHGRSLAPCLERVKISGPFASWTPFWRTCLAGPMTSTVDVDYLVIGAGAMGMAFTDALIDHDPDARVALVDRRDGPGGHWREAYPF